MRMYGRVGPNGNSDSASKVNPGKGQQPPFISTTLKRNEEAKEKLENPYYYYGSTRNQKKKLLRMNEKPKPLLPSQRAHLETTGKSGLLSDGFMAERSRPSSRQALLIQEKSQEANFQRSRYFVREFCLLKVLFDKYAYKTMWHCRMFQ